MTGTVALPLDEPPREPLAERWGGWLVSLFFHLMLLALLAQQIIPPPPIPPQSTPPRLHFTIAPPAPPEQPMEAMPSPAEPEPEPEPEDRPEEVGRTSDIGEAIDDIARSANPDQIVGRVVEDAAPVPDEEDLNAAPEVGDLRDGTILMTTPTGEDSRAPGEDLPEGDSAEHRLALDEDLAELLEREIALARAENRRQVIARTEIQGALWQEQEELDSSNADFISDGARHGSHREIDVSGVPFIIAQRVFLGLGATLENRVIDPAEIERNRGPLTVNAVTLPDGQRLTGRRVMEPGEGVVLEYGQELNAYLHLLEREALTHRNINPSDVAITRSVFAFEQDDVTGWGLTLREFEFVETD